MERGKTLFRRLTALAMVLCLVCLLSACQKKGDPAGPVKNDDRKPAGISADTDLILPYSREEGVNPFSATSLMNEAIMPLIYDGLYRIDASYEATPALVESSVVNGRTLMLTMSSERRFSDGSAISADDVKYSFDLAKNSLYYGTLLRNIDSAVAGGTTTISFTLSKPNQYIASDLTFPVVKAGTADKKDSVPVGSGRFVYKHSDTGGVLEKSDQYKSERFRAEKIYLLNIPDQETLFNSLNIESVNAAVDDLSDGVLNRVTASVTQFPLNNLVFIGIKENGALADASVRQALNAVLDRKTLISSGMSGYAVSSDIPLNPDWYGAKDLKKEQPMDRSKARTLLGERLAEQPLKLVTLAGNAFKEQIATEVAKELKSAGVACEIEALDAAVYRSAVSSGLYDLYVGEMRLTNDMDISVVLGDSQLSGSWDAVLSGASGCDAFVKAFYKQMPFLTIGFRTGMLAYSRNMKEDIVSIPGDPYGNVTDWKMS